MAWNLSDLLNLRLASPESIQSFLVSWDTVLAHSGSIVTEELKTALFLAQMERMPSMTEDLAHYRRMPDSDKCYSFLRNSIDKIIDDKRTAQQRQAQLSAMNGKHTVPGAAAETTTTASRSGQQRRPSRPQPVQQPRTHRPQLQHQLFPRTPASCSSSASARKALAVATDMSQTLWRWPKPQRTQLQGLQALLEVASENAREETRVTSLARAATPLMLAEAVETAAEAARLPGQTRIAQRFLVVSSSQTSVKEEQLASFCTL